MSGRLGRSGRRPRFPLTAQFPPAPHVANWEGILPGAAKPSTVKPPDIWEPTADDLAGLGNAGRTFLMRLHEQNESNLVQGVLLLEAAHAVDALATWRPLASTDKQAARLCVSLTKTVAALLAQIRVS